MTTQRFKTNIKCGNCVATVTPYLDEAAGTGNWTVNLKSPDRVLTVSAETASVAQIQEAIRQAGYKAEQVN